MELLNQRLVQVVGQLFPDAPIQSVRFWPLVDLAYSDLTTEVAFELAELLHKPPAVIASMIIKELGNEWGEFFEERGFVNLRLSNSALLRHTPAKSFRARGIVIAPPFIKGDRSEYFRMSALAILQTKLSESLNLDYEFKSFDERRPVLNDFLVATTVSQEMFVDWVIAQVQDRKIYCWVSPCLLDVPNFLAWSKPFYPHRMQVLSAPYEWANNAHWEDWVPVLNGILPTYEASLLMLLASSAVASELDLDCCHLQERRNIWWFLTSTLERIDKLELAVPAIEVGDFELTPHFKYLLIRSKFLNDYQFLAASQGRVKDFFMVLEEFLIQINWLLNQPELRVRAHEKRLKHFEQYIFTSVRGALSDIVVSLNMKSKQ